MAGALEAGYDLGAIAVLLMALAALYVVKDVTTFIAGLLDRSIFGYRPFHGLAVSLENGLISLVDGAIKDVEKLVARFASGLIDAFGLLIAIPLLLGLGVKAALEYLWTSALKPTVHSIADPIRELANRALSKANAAAAEIAGAEAALEKYARAQAADAVHDAEAYVERRLRSELSAIGGSIDAAIGVAERYADSAVSKLRAAEDAAVAGAVAVAAEAKVAGELAGRAALAAAEAEFGPEIAAASAAAAAGLAELDRAGKAALAGLEGVVITVRDDLHTIEGDLGLAGTAGLLASVPLLATLVHAIATEAGLENAECRSKVKGICGTDPSRWGDLLAGLGLLGIGFSLRELAELARPVVHELADVLGEAA